MKSVLKTRGIVAAERHIVAEEMPFGEGEEVEIMVWSPKRDDLAPEPAKERTPKAREAVMRAWLERVETRTPRLPSLSDYSMSRECIYRDEES